MWHGLAPGYARDQDQLPLVVSITQIVIKTDDNVYGTRKMTKEGDHENTDSRHPGADHILLHSTQHTLHLVWGHCCRTVSLPHTGTRALWICHGVIQTHMRLVEQRNKQRQESPSETPNKMIFTPGIPRDLVSNEFLPSSTSREVRYMETP